MSSWIAKAGDGPVTITCWLGAPPGTGVLVLERLLPTSATFEQVASNPAADKPVAYDQADDGSDQVAFRVAVVAGSPDGKAQGLYHKCEQAGAMLRYMDDSDHTIHPPPWAGVPLPPDCPNNELARRRFSLLFVT